ncbi:MAG: hypothetical protein C4522_05520 [Desulfobacteraceae bacterium]|nr:MAG: hypothetical protein C4522_05520 [Desulfobacteraceae bacterium]
MNKGKSGIIKIVALFMTVGIISGSGYAYYVLYEECNLLQADLLKSEKRGDLLQRKFVEEKTKAGALMRTKQSLENSMRAMQAQIDKAKTEKPAFEQELKNIEAMHAEKIKELEEKIETLLARIESLRTSREEVVAKYKEKAAVVQKNEEKIAQLSEDLQRTNFEWKRTDRQLENCRENNERLCLITEELVEKYKNKGVVGSIMITEPFTQLQKVEVEKLVQEYTAKIEKEKIE